jgi:hypothetical protein
MGNWVIVIQGTGSHHNGTEVDADVIAKSCLTKLAIAGQQITSATFTNGASETITPSPISVPLSNANSSTPHMVHHEELIGGSKITFDSPA